MDRWVVVAIIVAVLFGLYHVFTKLAAGRMPDAVGGFWLEGIAMVGMGIYLLVTRQPLWGPNVSRTGLVFALLGGVCVGLGTVLNFTAYRLGPLSAVGPIILLGGISMAVLVGVLFLGESLTLSRGIGWVLALIAIYLLSR